MKLVIPSTIYRYKAMLMALAFFAFGTQAFAQADLVCSATTLASSTICAPVGGTTAGSSYTAIAPLGCGSAGKDVWYKFIAQETNTTISLSLVTFANPGIQLFTGAACGAIASVACGTTSIAATGLTLGTTYYIRIYSSTNSTGTFSICMVDSAPLNDLCSGAIPLTTATGCATIYTLLNATSSAALTGCGNAASADVWFSYVATSHYPSIVLSGIGATYTAAVANIQLYSAGTCAAGVFSGTSIACATQSGATATLQTDTLVAGAGLTIGATYYIRVYSGSAGPFTAAGTAWQFKICLTDNTVSVPTVQYGKSYFNITKGVNGGTIEPGDTLQLRTTFFLSAGSTYNVSVTGTIPANTTYVPGTIRILTNEGQLYKQWTDAADGDPGTISGSTVTINIGKGATGTAGGTAKNNYRPSVFGSEYLVVATYQVKVNAVPYGTVINNLTAGTLSYSTNAVTPVVTNVAFPTVNAVVYMNTGICSNTVGSNGILSEFGGTFGSGNMKNRTPSSKVPANYTYTFLTTGNPADNFYGVSNNTSPGGANYSINPADPVAANHIFNVWDIIGDHTGAASPTAGNPPTDTTGGKTGGYMVVVNAAFRTDTAFLDTVKNLCPNTYYEYSTWFRNICRKCSGDSLGHGPSTIGYVPTGPGDTSGVHPNLTFNVNGYDYYTTGDVLYTAQWIKKGFTYLTGPAETQMIINIRNNAPGGGGNDWVMDDIGVATCTPNLLLNPATPTVNVCYGDGASLSAEVDSYFNNYTEYTWEVSSNNGLTYTSTGFGGSGITPVFNGTQYAYTATGPSFIGDSVTNRNIYRLRVASTPSNLSDTSCSFTAVRTVQVFVNSCLTLLKTNLINVSGNLQNDYAVLHWQTVNETEGTNFEIEKSADGIQFTLLGKVKGNGLNGRGSYSYNDPNALTTSGYYRIKMTEKTGFTYSKIILLSPGKILFAVNNLINPVTSAISCNVIIPADGDIRASIFDMYGRVVKTFKQPAEKGITALKIPDISGLSAGTYFFKVEWQNESIINKILKSN
jgi:trimeric autotransporter adhesin